MIVMNSKITFSYDFKICLISMIQYDVTDSIVLILIFIININQQIIL